MTNIDHYIARLAATLGISLADARARVAAQTAEQCRGRYGARAR